MGENLEEIKRESRLAAEEILAAAGLHAGEIFVVGCSTSEVRGQRIGSAGSEEVARSILAALLPVCKAQGVFLAIQCCEHLNRALVVERTAMAQYRLEQVSVVPVPKAGGALAAQAMKDFEDPVVVETIQAHAGLDIGWTMIGMHLKRVAVPVRLTHKVIGQAAVGAARTRPKLIGGERAVYARPAINIDCNHCN